MRNGQRVEFQLHRQANSLEEGLELWLDGEMQVLFFMNFNNQGR